MSLTAGIGERAGDDRDMARCAGLLDHQTAQPRAVIVEQRGRTHRARDEDGVFRQFVRQQDQALAGKLMQQAIGDVGQVVQPIAQVGVGLALQLGAGVVMDPLDRGLRGQAGAHRLAQPAQPAAIVRDHAEGLQHVAVLAVDAVVITVDQTVDRGAHGADRRLQPHKLQFHVIGDDRGHRHARLVHHHMAEAEPVGDAQALERHLTPHGD